MATETQNTDPKPTGNDQTISISRNVSGTSRVSETPGRQMLLAGGLGYIARRNIPYRTALLLQSIGGVETLARFQPLELLMLCADIVPELGTAVWNFLLLGCAPDRVRLKAMTQTLGEDGQPDGGSEEAPDGSALINALFENQPQEGGGFQEQLIQNVLMVLFTAMAATEAVPGPEMTGIARTWPVDTLSLMFRRDQKTGELVLDQQQGGPYIGNVPTNIGTSGAGTNMVPMPMNRFFWASMHGFPGDPYGRSPLAPVLNPLLDYLGFIRDLTIAFHRVGMPRYDIDFDFVGAVEMATKVKQLSDPTLIANEVKRMFEEYVTNFNTLKIDDAFVHPTGTKVNVTGSGSEMPDVESIFDIYRYRLILALKQNPVLMSFVEGSTETWSDIQWEVFTNGLNATVSPGVSPLKDAATLHLRLLGKPYKVEVEFKPARSIQRLQDAQAEAVEIENESQKRDEGWQTQESSSQAVTGSSAVADAPSPTPAIPATAPPPPGSEQPPKPDAPADPKRPRTPGGTPPGPAPAPKPAEAPPHKRAEKPLKKAGRK